MSEWSEEKSYAAKITCLRWLYDDTTTVYRSALRRIIDVVNERFDELNGLNEQESSMHIEHLIHSTKGHKAKYPFFDIEFVKFPSYVRRDCINRAVGIVKAYRSEVEAWEQNGHRVRTRDGNLVDAAKPKLSVNHCLFPTLFRKNMFRCGDGLSEDCSIKVYNGKDWVWKDIHLNASDVKYINSRKAELCAPVIEKHGHRWFLRFALKCSCRGTDKVGRVVSADLGRNHDAVCAAMDPDGTVAGRRFIDFPAEKDHLYGILDEIDHAKSCGSVHTPRLWRFADGYQNDIVIRTARAIVQFALDMNAGVIVMEHLDMKGCRSAGSRKRLAFWRYAAVREKVKSIAHRAGIRVSTVFAAGTSRYAFDGSGTVTRDPDNHSLCTFSTGKRYNCDLSAAYNIAARYFIRCKEKTMQPQTWRDAKAKVPGLSSRSTCTLDTLIRLLAEAGPLAA